MTEAWIQKHISGSIDFNDPGMIEALDWIKSRPRKVKELMLQFPPSCVVKSAPGRELICPPKGKHGFVTGYVENTKTGKMLINVGNPDMHMIAQCEPEWLRVTHYWKDLTPQRLQQLISSALA